MTTIAVDLPAKVLAQLNRSSDEVARDVRLATAIEWYRRGLISQGKAAELAGIPRADLIDELAARKIPVVQVDLDELREEIEGG